VRIALDTDRSPRTGLRIALDGNTCAPCQPAAEPTSEQTDELTGRVIIRYRAVTGVDDDGVSHFDWDTAYDGPASWSEITTNETDDGSSTATEHATVTIPNLDVDIETTASLWDHNRQRWTVTGITRTSASGVQIKIERELAADD
jgi:hypothetical protein